MDFSSYFTNINPSQYNLTVPDVNTPGSFNSVVSFFTSFINMLLQLIDALLSTFDSIIKYLLDTADLFSDMTSSLISGQTGGYPILEAVGCYRYLVGDFVFILTYIMISLGLLLVIWHLIQIIYSRISNSVSSGGIGNVISMLSSKLP